MRSSCSTLPSSRSWGWMA